MSPAIFKEKKSGLFLAASLALNKVLTEPCWPRFKVEYGPKPFSSVIGLYWKSVKSLLIFSRSDWDNSVIDLMFLNFLGIKSLYKGSSAIAWNFSVKFCSKSLSASV